MTNTLCCNNSKLNMSGSANPAGSVGLNSLNVPYNVGSETMREPPPPYSPSANSAVDSQPPSIIHQTIIVQAPLKDAPTFYMCPRCQDRILTKVEYVSSKGTHMLAGFLCGLSLRIANKLGMCPGTKADGNHLPMSTFSDRWCCLCCLAALPYYLQTFKKAQHFCPNCNELLGTYSKF